MNAELERSRTSDGSRNWKSDGRAAAKAKSISAPSWHGPLALLRNRRFSAVSRIGVGLDCTGILSHIRLLFSLFGAVIFICTRDEGFLQIAHPATVIE